MVDDRLQAALSGEKVFALTGANGPLGKAIAARLSELGVAQRLVVRDVAGAPRLGGAEVTEAEGEDLKAMSRALSGVRTALLTQAGDGSQPAEEHATTVDAAIAAGVERIVYVSFLAAAPDATFEPAREHFEAEQHTRSSGVSYTFLRPSPYLEEVPSMSSASGVIENGAGEGRVAHVSRADVADVAVVVMAGARHHGATYDLTGSESRTMTEIADLLTVAVGRQVTYSHSERPPPGSADGDAAAGASESLFAAIATGELDIVTDTVALLTGREPRTLAGYLRDNPESYAHIEAA